MTESVALPPQNPWVHHVLEYRVYLIDSDGHFYQAVPLVCANDDEAIEQAKQLVNGHDVELWQRDRKIAAFNKAG